MDTFIVFAARYDTQATAEADYRAVRDFYQASGRLDTFDAAVITKDEAGKVSIAGVKHRQPARRGAWHGLGIELADGALVALVEDIEAAAGTGQSLQQAVAESEAALAEAEAEAEAAERAAERYSTFQSSPGGSSNDLATQLGDLARLRESGALSTAEFETAKSRLLGG